MGAIDRGRGRSPLAATLTIGISSFERAECVLRLVDSIEQFYPNVRIIIADDSSPDVRYAIQSGKDWPEWPHVTFLPLDYDCGLSVKRNAIVAATETELLCLCDDDFVFTDLTRLEDLIAAIDAGCDLASGAVGDTVPYCHAFVRRGSVMFEEIVRPENAETFAGYPLYGLLLNFFVARTESIRPVPWDPPLKMHEHGDWFLRIAHLKKTYVPTCLVDHKREAPGEYAEHRRTKVVNCLDLRMQRLIERGLTHYVSDDRRIMVVERQKRHQEAPRAPRTPVSVKAALANPVGPQPKRTAMQKAAKVSVVPPPPAPKPIQKPLSIQELPTAPAFPGLPHGFDLSESPIGAIPELLTDLFSGQRVLVLGSAPQCELPDDDEYDVVVAANGGIYHARAEAGHPTVAVLTTDVLGLVRDGGQSYAQALDGYEGWLLDAVIIHGGGWTDLHDRLSSTWYERADSDAAELVIRGCTVPNSPLGLTPAGRDRVLASATGQQLLRGSIGKDQPSWEWQRAGWSTGIVAACVAWSCGAATVCLAGISLEPGHVHEDYDAFGARNHQGGDLAVLRDAAMRHGERWMTTSAALAQATGLASLVTRV